MEHSVVSTGCVVEEGAVVKNAFIMPDTVVKKGATVQYSIVSAMCLIGENAKVGREPKSPGGVPKKICVLSKHTVVADGESITE